MFAGGDLSTWVMKINCDLSASWTTSGRPWTFSDSEQFYLVENPEFRRKSESPICVSIGAVRRDWLSLPREEEVVHRRCAYYFASWIRQYVN